MKKPRSSSRTSSDGAKAIVEIIEAAQQGTQAGAKWDGAARRKPDSRRRDARPWLDDCQTDDKGHPIANLANTLCALRSDWPLVDLLSYDQMAGAVMLQAPVPEAGDPFALPDDDFRMREFADTDLIALQEYLQLAGLPRVTKDTLHDAVTRRAQECAFHPVRQYLDALTWDGRPRLISWLHTYVGADDTRYAALVGKMFMVSMIARIYEPGCKVDHMLVLEGPQGAMKSTLCRILGGEWFSDCMPDVTGGKDASIHLQGKWLIEVAEMSALSRAEDAALKAFLTRQVERFRPPYGRTEENIPRQCVFIGTTNKSAYLRDETGGRRYWPIKVGQIDPDGLARDRDQLLAEALQAYRDGFQWWPGREFEMECIRPEQEARYEGDAWEALISRHLAGCQRVTVHDVAMDGLGFDKSKISRADQNRITACLERLGWCRGKRGGAGERWWVPPDAPSSDGH